MGREGRKARCWTYAKALHAVPHVRRLLATLRETFIAAWHFHRLGRGREVDFHRGRGVAALGELDRLGVLAYQNPLRGIALFPFVVEGRGGRRQAYLVYKDTRDGIDAHVLGDELCGSNDLYDSERPVPDAWKAGRGVPPFRDGDDRGPRPRTDS